MSDLIDRQAAINEFLHFADEHDSNDGLWHWTGIKAILESLPSAQPEIIKCRECKHWQYDFMTGRGWCDGRERSEDWFCADGERREDG